MGQCRKCNKNMPATLIIEGKRRNLKNRKFCFECSPFGSHNTKPDDPRRKSVFGQKDYKKSSYTNWDEKAKLMHRAKTWKRGEERKLKLINLKGGCCKKCGYNKCSRSMSFHHRNPKEKSFQMDTRWIRGKKWEDLLKEADKCDLLCANCHMELHAEEECLYRKIIEESGQQDSNL